ncbi:MAG: type III pantothenate kinase [Deltaproteobacteria bacterium]|nr:type III pantothenate kinase [Deltaproteobacteria bacterium]
MLMVMDIGNTHTVIGIFHKNRMLYNWRIHTDPKLTEDELNILFSHFFAQSSIAPEQIEKTIISCVVPPIMNTMDSYCIRYLKIKPTWITPALIDMPILYHNPEEVGADRLVNAVAAFDKYRQSLIVIDFGTATTFDCISEAGAYIGGAIAPGIGISAEALFQRASKLPRVELFNPPKSVIGKETTASMKSGLLYGYAEMVDGMIRRIKREMAPDCPYVIATGGLSGIIKSISSGIEALEPDLTLEGLRIISTTTS